MWGRGVTVFLMAVQAIVAGAQRTGTLRLELEPANATYRLDHQFALSRPEIELMEGAHHFSFWAPQRRMVDTTLTIIPGKITGFSLRLPYSTEYLVYQRNLAVWTKERRLMRLVPAVATGGALLWTALAYGGMKKAHDRLDEDRTAYGEAGSPQAVTVLKEQDIPVHKDEFAKARNQFRVAAGVAVLCAGATAWLYLRSAHRPKPVFEDKEKLRFEGLSWAPGDHGGQWTGGLTWNFAR